MKAIWNNQIIAESDKTVMIENNHYFPPSSVKMELLKKSGNVYECPWKGHCDYYNIEVDGGVNEDAAWIYPKPSDAAKEITGHVAFWKGVEITE
jgi:uncharacterized protein (DUF427 family)